MIIPLLTWSLRYVDGGGGKQHTWVTTPFSPQPAEDDADKLKHLPPAAQQILDEFALRYSIENLFRSMMWVLFFFILHADGQLVSS